MNNSQFEKEKHDEFGLTKFIMALLISICHYSILIGAPLDVLERAQINVFFREVLLVLIRFGVRFGGRLPICFFVLSGYLFQKVYADRINNGIYTFKEFIKKRIIRLYPLMLISIMFFAIEQWIFYYNNGEWWTNRNSGIWNIAISLTGIGVGTFANAIDTVNGPIWYISVLMIVYSIAFIMETLLKKPNVYSKVKSKTLYFSIPIIVGLAIRYYDINIPFMTYYTATGYIGFFLGIIIYERRMENNRGAKIFALINLILFLACFIIYRKLAVGVLGEDDLFLGFLIMPSMIVLVRMTRMVWQNSFFDYLSKMSFPIYLFHIPIMLGQVLMADLGVYHNELIMFAMTYVIIFIVSFVLTQLSKARIMSMVGEIIAAFIEKVFDINWQ